MRIVDANVLLNAVNRSAADHQVAKRWLDDALSGGGPIGLAWVVLLAVARLTTRPGLFTRPLTVTEVTGLLRGLLDAPTAIVVHPGERHLDLLELATDIVPDLGVLHGSPALVGRRMGGVGGVCAVHPGLVNWSGPGLAHYRPAAQLPILHVTPLTAGLAYG